MRVESEAGRGTALTLVLPVGLLEAEPPSAPGDAEHQRRGRILLVDNELLVMHILGEMLSLRAF
jgi:hypothetical protein